MKPLEHVWFSGTAGVCGGCCGTKFLSISTGDVVLPPCGGGEMREVEGVLRWEEKLEERSRAGWKGRGAGAPGEERGVRA